MAEKKDVRERRTEEQLLDDIESMEERLKIYRRRLAKRRAQDSKREQAWRNHALIVIGGMVESHFIGGWKGIDFDKLNSYLNTYDKALKGKAAIEPYKNASDANTAVRDFERRQREVRKAARETLVNLEEPRYEDTPEPMF